MKKCLTPDELEAKAIDYTKTLTDAGIKSFPDQIKYFMDKGDKAKHQLALMAPFMKDAYKKLGFGNDEAIDNFDIAKHVQTLDALSKENNKVKPEGSNQAPVSHESAKFVSSMIEKAFPGVKQNFLTGEEFKAKHGNEAKGAFHEGQIDINSDHLNANTQVHEAGHLWMAWAKAYAPELYQEGLRLASEDSVGIQRAIDKGYGHLSPSELHEEVAAHAIGEQGENRLNATPKAQAERSWTDKIFDKVRSFVERTMGIKLSPDFQNQSLTDFAAQVANKLLSGNKISDITSDQIKAFEKDTGITRFDLQDPPFDGPDDESVNERAREGVRNAMSSHIAKSEGLKTDNVRVKDVTTLERGSIVPVGKVLSSVHEKSMIGNANEAIKAGIEKGKPASSSLKGYFYDILDKIAQTKDTRLGTESPIHKAFTQDLYPALKEIGTDKFYKDFETMGQQIEDHTFNINSGDYSDGFRKLFNNLIKHFDQYEHLDKNGDSVIINEDWKINPNALRDEGARSIGVFQGKVNDILGKNKTFRKITAFANDHFLANVENISTWAKSLSGSENTLLYKLAQAVGVHAVGNDAVYRSNFNSDNIPLLRADWFQKGSHTQNPDFQIHQLDTEVASGESTHTDESGAIIKTTYSVPLTTEEWFSFFMQSQRDERTRATWFGTPEEPKTITMALADIKGREAKEVSLGYDHYKQALEKFDPHHDEIVKGWVEASSNLGTAVNREFKKENGIALIPINSDRAEGQKWGYYYPHTLAKEKSEVHELLKQNKFVNDIASHKTYSPTGDEKYSIKSAVKTMQDYRDGNAKYAASAMAVKNMDNYFAANMDMIKEMGLEKQAQWWKQCKADMFNPEKSAAGFWGSKIIGPYMLSKLGMNVFVSLKQFTAIPLAVNAIPTKYLLRSQSALFSTLGGEVKNYDMFTDWMNKAKTPNAIIDEMNMRSGYALYRNTNGNSEMQRYVQEASIPDYFSKTISKVIGKDLKISKNDLMKNIQTPDKAIGAMYWSAAKMMVQEEHQLFPERDGQKFWDKVEDTYIKAITESQHSSDDANRSQLARSNTFLGKSLTLFGSQQIAAFSGLQSRAIDFINDRNPETAKALAIQAMNVAVTNAAMVATIETGRFLLLGSSGALAHHKPEDVYADKFFEGMTSNIPILGPGISAIESKYRNGMYGRDMTYPIYEVVNDGYRTIAAGLHAGGENSDKQQQHYNKDLFNSLMYSAAEITGVPTTPLVTAKKILVD